MMRFFSLLILLPLLSFNYLFGQKATLTGKITDTKKQSLPGVTVIADSSTTGTISDINGDYSLPLDTGSHKIVFKMIGMKEKTMRVNLKEGETNTLNVLLEESSQELGVVVVSASKFEQKIEEVTVSMNVIKPSLVEDKNTVTMDEIINQSPSVSIIDNQANIRGGSGWSYGAGSRVLMLVDDLPMLTADANDTKWSFLPVENLQQIEVIKGASSALYGSSALNGVINIRTAYPKDTPETRVNFFSGIYDNRQKLTLNDTTYDLNWNGKTLHKNSGLNFFHSRRIKNFDLVIGGNAFADDSYRLGEFEQRIRGNANIRYRFKNIEGLSCGVNFNTMLTEGRLLFIWQNDTTGAYVPSSVSDYTTYRTNIDPFITYADNKGNTHRLRTRYFRSNNINNTNQGSIADLYYGEYQYQKRFNDKLTATGGLVGSISKVKSELYTGDDGNGKHEGNNIAAYLQGDFHVKRLTISLGGRIERNKVDSIKDDFTPVFRAGVNYRVFEATYVRASYGQGYRYPSIAEKYIATKVGGLTVYPNDSLTSEKGYAAEIGIMQGVKFGEWNGYFDIAAFNTEYHNMIEFTFSQWAQPTFVPVFDLGVGFKALNIGDTRIRGLDFSFVGEGNVGPLRLSVLAGYTYMEPYALNYDSSYIKAQHKLEPDSVYKAYLGSDSTNFLKYRFKHLLKADVGIGYKKFALGISAQYNSFMENIDKIFVDPNFGPLITPGVDHYRTYHRTGDIVFDLRASCQLTKTTKLSFIVKNLFNHIYMQRPADMQAPRTYTAQLTIGF